MTSASGANAPEGDVPFVILRTPEQVEADATLRRMLQHPAIVRTMAEVRLQLLADPEAGAEVTTQEGRDQLDYTLPLWTATVILQHLRSNRGHPAFLWGTNTPHTWFGITAPGCGTMGENADNVYRTAYIDGSRRYEIRGRIPPNGPTQFSFDLEHGQPGKALILDKAAMEKAKAAVDPGRQVGMLPDTMIDVDHDGNFTIELGPEPGPERNFLQTEQGNLSILYRNSLCDWRQRPTSISIRCLDPIAATKPLDEDELVQRVVNDLPDWIMAWAHQKQRHAPPPYNVLKGPHARHGNWWGAIANGYYKLADDEALVITIETGGAAYTGVQLSNRWFMSPDASRHLSSRSLAQAQPNADGSYTYVIAVGDPGPANWVSTAGSHEGYAMFRWQQMAEDADASGLIRQMKVVQLSQLQAELPPETRWITPQQRAEELAERARQFEAIHAD